jgi:aspartate racemase
MQFELYIIHPYKLLVTELANKIINNLVFFGTKYTNDNSNIASYCVGLSIEKLRKYEIVFLDDLRKKVYFNTETNQDIRTYNTMISKYSENNTVIIACTELSIINTSSSERVIDLALLQCRKSLELVTN